MQDRFVGDVGDFGKYGLLRALTKGLEGCDSGLPTGLGDNKRELSLGVIWYYVATEGQLPRKGTAFNYLNQTTRLHAQIRECDRNLFDVLSALIAEGNRHVSAVAQSNALPVGVVYVQEPVNGVLPRPQWFLQAAESVNKCELVFIDPDKGLVFDEGNLDRVSDEHATYQEVTQLWKQGHSLIIYQDASRREVLTFAREQSCLLKKLLPGSDPIPLVYHRHGPRILWVVPSANNSTTTQLLRERIDTFLGCCWGAGRDPHFTCVDL